MKPGRNDPCPCGSGKKYKQCCLAAEQAELQSPEELLWRQLRRELDGFQMQLHRFINEHYGPDALDDAWWAFHLWTEEEDFFDADSPLIEPFVTWMAYEWQPDDDDACEGFSIPRSPTSSRHAHGCSARVGARRRCCANTWKPVWPSRSASTTF